ncbi:MAG: hypothetical protein ACYCO5_02920 [Acidobacteriaceae bacterium]
MQIDLQQESNCLCAWSVAGGHRAGPETGGALCADHRWNSGQAGRGAGACEYHGAGEDGAAAALPLARRRPVQLRSRCRMRWACCGLLRWPVEGENNVTELPLPDQGQQEILAALGVHLPAL